MSFLDDILENDASLSKSTITNDPTLYELVFGAAQAGNVSALRSAISNGQVPADAPIELVKKIVGIAGDKAHKYDARQTADRLLFLDEWLELTTPKDSVARKNRLDELLSACFSNLLHVNDVVISRLIDLGANPLAMPDSPSISGSNEKSMIGRRLSVIGTAGRDKTQIMNAQLWERMLGDIRQRVRKDDCLVSGGAAWADHLAVAMYLEGSVSSLVLHLPAPFDGHKFSGPRSSSASTANYYHQLFSTAIGFDSMSQIQQAIKRGAKVSVQPESAGYSGLFARNKLVAQDCDNALAYTFSEDDSPSDGGTANTWAQISGKKTHVSLVNFKSSPGLTEQEQPPQDISGSRLGLAQLQATTLAQAIYCGSGQTGKMLIACDSNDIRDAQKAHSIPNVAIMTRGDKRITLNALSYALSIADLRQVNLILGACDTANLDVQRQMGEAITQVMDLGLHEFGADEVHYGIAKIIASGACGPGVSSFSQQFFTLTPTPCLKFRDAQGAFMDLDAPASDEVLRKSGIFTLPVSFIFHPNSHVALRAFEQLHLRGWNPNSNAELPVSTRGASVFHLACSRGDHILIDGLKALGADIQKPDLQGKTPVEYAFWGENRQAAFKIDPSRAKQMQALVDEQMGILPTDSGTSHHLDDVNYLLSLASAGEGGFEEQNATPPSLPQSKQKTTNNTSPQSAVSLFSSIRQSNSGAKPEVDHSNHADSHGSSSINRASAALKAIDNSVQQPRTQRFAQP